MNEELQELLKSTLAEFKQELLSEVDSRVNSANQGVASNLSKQLKKLQEQIPQSKQEELVSSEDNTESKETKLTLKALQQQIADLNSQLQLKDQAAFEAEKKAAISKVIANANAISKPLLQKVFSIEYGPKLQKEGDQWFFNEGDNVVPIDQLLSNYFNTEDGKSFIPPSNSQGSGATESKIQISNSKEPMSLDDKWAAIASNLYNQ
jgi:hypothetical protein